MTARLLCGRSVHPIGFGAMPLSWPAMLDDRDRSIETIHAALDAGCRHIDSSNVYAPSWEHTGHNEVLVAEAVDSWVGHRSELVVATKGGLIARSDRMDRDGTAAGLRSACAASLERLGVATIDLYYLHRADPTVAFETQVETLAGLQADGLIAEIGLSNVSREQLALAMTIAPIAAVQNELSPRYREHRDVLDLCARHGVAYLPWSPFGGADRSSDVASQYAAFADVGAAHGCSAHRVALAWLLAQAPNVIPIPGSTRPETILDSLDAAGLELSADELALLDATEPEGTSQYPDDMPTPPLRA
ncbi:MAG: aldo/keto reductase [Ilumatobacter sp.]|uniref:aldo/keto reductase n=1 Tax=Ilumatobacter sp. TaxID=1967498 RepID=UPI003C76D14F